MREQRVNVDVRKVEMVLTTGERLKAETFTSLYGLHLTGPQRVGDLLNADENFMPVRVADKVQLVNLNQVVAVSTDAGEEFDPLLKLGETYQVQVSTFGGDVFNVQIFVNLPHGQNRVKDFLNVKRRFLLSVQGEQVVYLAKQHILTVID